MKLKPIFIHFILFLFTFSLILGCNVRVANLTVDINSDNYPRSTIEKVDLKLGFSAWPGWIPWQVAQDLDLFADNRLNVDLQWFDGYLDSIIALNRGDIDANCQTLGDTIASVAGDADLVVVLTNDNSTGNDKVIVRRGIDSIADLKGKKVAAEEGTVDHFLLLQGLQKAGMSSKDIKFVSLETSQAAAAFVEGKVDAVAVFAPFTTTALKREGSKELFSSRDFPGSISDHLVFTRKFVENYPDRVQATVDTWFDTLDRIKKNPVSAKQIMAERAGVTVTEYEQYSQGTKIFSIADNLKSFQTAKDMSSLSFAAKKMSNFLLGVGIIQNKPDSSGLFDDRFVKAHAKKMSK